MLKNRLSYIAFAVVIAILMFFFSSPFMFYVLAAQAVLTVAVKLLIVGDSKSVNTEFKIKHGACEGRYITAEFKVISEKNIFAANSVLAEIEIYNKMFNKTENRKFLFYISGKESSFKIDFEAEQCGEVNFICKNIKIFDIFNIFGEKIKPFGQVCTIVYPRQMNLNVEMSDITFGTNKTNSFMLKRKGNDPSEMFDIKEYFPGDDIRSIHWKLSCKTNNLVLRQASDPSDYNVVIMPDIGLKIEDKEVSETELNTAAAICFSLGEQLIKNGEKFCMAFVLPTGLCVNEIITEEDFQKSLAQWLSLPVPYKSGDGLKYFIMEHMEYCFTRLIILSAGKYNGEINSVAGRVSISVINAVDDGDFIHSSLSAGCDITEIPSNQNSDRIYNIIC